MASKSVVSHSPSALAGLIGGGGGLFLGASLPTALFFGFIASFVAAQPATTVTEDDGTVFVFTGNDVTITRPGAEAQTFSLASLADEIDAAGAWPTDTSIATTTHGSSDNASLLAEAIRLGSTLLT